MMQSKRDKDALLEALRELSRKGPIDAVSAGSSAIGRTLQAELKIDHSVSSRNSKFGYTITSTTSALLSSSRTNLFACVADWDQSLVKSSTELVQRFGREALERGYIKSLFCTLNALIPNGLGLKLAVNRSRRQLTEVWQQGETLETILVWDVAVLEAKLKKLGNNAIVTGLPVRRSDGRKAFHFRYVDVLGEPDVSAFLSLIEEGIVTLDHCISQKVGSKTGREQGPLFKIRGDSRDQLYKTSDKFDLLDI